MIKLFGFIYINPLTILLFILFYLNGNIKLLTVSYAIMIIHEMCHLIAAVLIGLKPGYITIHPFGVCLKLKNKIIRSFSDEIILYLAGPFSNILMALWAKFFLPADTDFLYYSNIFLFITNMLPILPLDGGMLTKRILTYFYGEAKAKNIMIFISVLLCMILFAIGTYLIYINSFNYSVIVLSAMTGANIFTQKEKYSVDYTKELMYYSSKKADEKKRVRLILHHSGSDIRKAVSEFRPSDYSLVCVIDDNDNITELLTEKKVLNSLFK